MAPDRLLLDVRDSLRALSDCVPTKRRRTLDDATIDLLANCDALLDSIEDLLEPATETPGERAARARRPRRGERDQRSPGERVAEAARSLSTETRAAQTSRRRDRGRF